MIVKVLAYAGKILDKLDPLRFKILSRRNTTPLEDLRSVNCTSREDDLPLRTDGPHITAGHRPELDGGDLFFLVDE